MNDENLINALTAVNHNLVAIAEMLKNIQFALENIEQKMS